jgi:uncharacterized membrane protein (DUF2068 family)
MDRPKRPRGVTLLALGVLIIAVLNLTRLLTAIRIWLFLEEILPFSGLYLIATGLIWAGSGLPLFWGLWRGLSWAPDFCWIAAIAYLIYYWLDRLLLANHPGRQANLPFAAGASLVVILLIYWILSRPKTKAYFRHVPLS